MLREWLFIPSKKPPSTGKPPGDQKQERNVIIDSGNQQSPGLTKWQLNVQKRFQELFKDLLGLERDPNGNVIMEDKEGNRDKYSVNPDKQIINDEGLHRVKMTVNSIVNPSTIMSDIDEEDVVYTMRDIDGELAFNLAMKMDEYDMDIADRDLALSALTRLTHISLKRAEDGGERDFLSGTERRHEVTRQSSEGKKGLLSRFLPGGD